jgi:hypothetical protein
VRAMV